MFSELKAELAAADVGAENVTPATLPVPSVTTEVADKMVPAAGPG